MRIWPSLTLGMLVVAAVIGFLARDYDVFLWTFLVGSALVLALAVLLKWGRDRETEALKAKYKPYQIKLLEGVAKPLERRRLVPLNKKPNHPQ